VEKFVKGNIVVVPFPFSDLSATKKRLALVLANLDGDDIILCQITSQQTKDKYAIPLKEKDYRFGKLAVPSNVRPNRIFTADKNIIIKKIASLDEVVVNVVMQKIIAIFSV